MGEVGHFHWSSVTTSLLKEVRCTHITKICITKPYNEITTHPVTWRGVRRRTFVFPIIYLCFPLGEPELETIHKWIKTPQLLPCLFASINYGSQSNFFDMWSCTWKMLKPPARLTSRKQTLFLSDHLQQWTASREPVTVRCPITPCSSSPLTTVTHLLYHMTARGKAFLSAIPL